MKQKTIFIATVSQILAIATHIYLTISHFRLKYGLAEGKSLCNISQKLNCDVVSMSQYATVLNSPLALWGILANLLLLILCLNAAKPFYLRSAQVFSALTLMASLAMAAISATQLNTWCLFCVAAYALSFVTFAALVGKTAEMTWSDYLQAITPKKLLKSAIALALIPLGAVFIASVVKSNLAGEMDDIVSTSIQTWKTSPDVNLSSAQGLTLGADPAKAKMLIVEFADFQCIHCKMAAPILKAFVLSRPDVSLVFQSFPLDGMCNPAVKFTRDGMSCDLAKAVYCSYRQSPDKGWVAHEWVYENFGHLAMADLMEFANQQGLDMNLFRTCREAPETTQAILQQAALGEKAGVQGTPTLFVNGRQLPGGQFEPVLESAYKELH